MSQTTALEVRTTPRREGRTWLVVSALWQAAFMVIVIVLVVDWLRNGDRSAVDVLGILALVVLTLVLLVRPVPDEVRRIRRAFAAPVSGEVVLRLDDHIAVLNVSGAGRGFAVLSWSDCAAVVCSALSQGEAIVQFVPSDDRRVVLPGPEALESTERLAQRLHLSLPAAAMAYPSP